MQLVFCGGHIILDFHIACVLTMGPWHQESDMSFENTTWATCAPLWPFAVAGRSWLCDRWGAWDSEAGRDREKQHVDDQGGYGESPVERPGGSTRLQPGSLGHMRQLEGPWKAGDR